MHAADSFTRERRYIVRNVEGGMLLERFFVSAVLAFVLLRFYLELTGFPRVGGHGLHIAHMLWGGLLMLSAVVLLLAFLGGTVRNLAAILGGIGFGVFIDELGKFITSDNNYFYRPAVALIYIVFVGLFLVLRRIERDQPRSTSAYLVNALEASADAILHGFAAGNCEHALAALSHVPPGDPAGDALRSFLAGIAPGPDPAPSPLARLERWLHDRYRRLVRSEFLTGAVMTGFGLYAVVATAALIVVATSAHVAFRRAAFSLRADILFVLLADVLILVGALHWRHSRLAGMLWFKRAILVTILLAQPFLFYREQLVALIWLALDIVILEALTYSIDQERQIEVIGRVPPETAVRAATLGVMRTGG